MTRILSLSVATTCVVLAGCGPFPDARMVSRTPLRQAQPEPPPGRSADIAESACFEAGRSAGFDVQRLVGSTEVLGPDGLSASRDVMIAVRRGSQTFEVRCSYAYATNSARIMTL